MALRDAASLLVGLLVLSHTWGAWAAVEVNMEDKVEVMLGKTAQIACMFSLDDGILAMVIQWFYVTRSNEKQRIYYQDATMRVVDRGTPFSERISVNGSGLSGEVVLTISDVQLADELEFICLIKSLTDGTAEGRTRLRVFEVPQLPTIEGVLVGVTANDGSLPKLGTCEVRNGYPKPNITWHRNNTPLRSIPNSVNVVSRTTIESSGLYSVTSELMMSVVKEDKDAKFYCEVTYFVPGATRMTETSRINITVHYPHEAVNIWLESPKGKVKEGDTMELRCDGDGNPSSSSFTIKQVKDDGDFDIDFDVDVDVDDDGDGADNVLVMKNVSRQNSGVYKCMWTDLETTEITANTSVFVHYLDPAFVPEDTVEVVHGEQLQTTCNALSSLPTETAWFKDGQQLATGHTLTLDGVTFDTSGVYTCVVTVPEVDGMQTSAAVTVNVAGTPIITEEDSDLESYEESVQLTCHARGYPAPEMYWTTSDGKEVKTTPTETADGYESTLTVQVTSNITAVCQASNSFGTASVTFNITASTHTTKPATTTTIPSTTGQTDNSSSVQTENVVPAQGSKKEGKGVIIAVIIICILLLAILGSVLYFLYKKGKICGRSGKQDLTKEKSSKDNIVVEMKSDNTEEAILLGVNGEKQLPNEP